MELPLMPQPPYPLHPSVANRLAGQYVTFYNNFIQHLQQSHYQPIAASRLSGKIIAGSSRSIPVGKIQDLSICRKESTGSDGVPIRCFIPAGEPPSTGWPVMLYFHGGGFVLGGIDTENPVCTNLCMRASSVVITTDYRLAPEHPFPAAVHDCFETLRWITAEGQQTLNLDLSKVAIGGSSAGANLAAVMTQKALARPDVGDKIKFKAQLLVVPVTDNTATPETNPTWKEFEFTAALPALKMAWYREHYLPDPLTHADTEASPLLLPSEDFARLPTAVILVAELDVMRHEGEMYARKLKEAGVPVRLEIFRGMPHTFLSHDAALDEGKRAISVLCDSLSEAFR